MLRADGSTCGDIPRNAVRRPARGRGRAEGIAARRRARPGRRAPPRRAPGRGRPRPLPRRGRGRALLHRHRRRSRTPRRRREAPGCVLRGARLRRRGGARADLQVLPGRRPPRHRRCEARRHRLDRARLRLGLPRARARRDAARGRDHRQPLPRPRLARSVSLRLPAPRRRALRARPHVERRGRRHPGRHPLRWAARLAARRRPGRRVGRGSRRRVRALLGRRRRRGDRAPVHRRGTTRDATGGDPASRAWARRARRRATSPARSRAARRVRSSTPRGRSSTRTARARPTGAPPPAPRQRGSRPRSARRAAGADRCRRPARVRQAASAALLFALLAAGTAVAATAPAPPAVDAAAYLVVGDLDGRVLAARDADRARPIASITKLMTVLVALDRLGLDEIVTVPPAVAGIGESSIQLRAGERISVRDLAIAALVPSANDAATALALAAGEGSVERFVKAMNARARCARDDRHELREPARARPGGALLDRARHGDAPPRRAPRAVHPAVRRGARGDDRRAAGRSSRPTTSSVASPASSGQRPGTRRCRLVAGRGRPSGRGRDRPPRCSAHPTRRRGTRASQRLLEWGLTRYARVATVDAGRVYASVAVGWGKPPVVLRPARTLVRPVALDVPLRRARRRTDRRPPLPSPPGNASARCGSTRAGACRARRRSSPTARSTGPASSAGSAGTQGVRPTTSPALPPDAAARAPRGPPARSG